MQTAMRLVRPQDIAAESLSSVAQTVREEVNLLVDGVEQAVAGQHAVISTFGVPYSKDEITVYSGTALTAQQVAFLYWSR